MNINLINMQILIRLIRVSIEDIGNLEQII